MKNIIIVFTKVPKNGVSKTRLTLERGGILEPAESVMLYEGMLIDVINVCIAADCGEVKICYDVAGDRSYLDKVLQRVAKPNKIGEIYHDEGGSFDECMQFAADHVLCNGTKDRLADSVIIVGGDLPSLEPGILQDTLKKLKRLAALPQGMAVAVDCDAKQAGIGACVVEGACQEGGFSIIGYTASTPFNFTGVFYNMTGVTTLDMTANKVIQDNIPVSAVEMTPDIDIPIDLGSMIPVMRILEQAALYDENILAPVNTMKVINDLGLESQSSPPKA